METGYLLFCFLKRCGRRSLSLAFTLQVALCCPRPWSHFFCPHRWPHFHPLLWCMLLGVLGLPECSWLSFILCQNLDPWFFPWWLFFNFPFRRKVVTQIWMLLNIFLTMLCRYLPKKAVYKLAVLAHSFYAAIDSERWKWSLNKADLMITGDFKSQNSRNDLMLIVLKNSRSRLKSPWPLLPLFLQSFHYFGKRSPSCFYIGQW